MINSLCSKKGNVCKSKHLDFEAPRAAAEKKSTRALGAPKSRCLDLHTFPFLERHELLIIEHDK